MSTQPILIGDSRKITELGDMLNTPKLSHGHAREISRASLDAHQGDTEQIDSMGLSLPSSDAPLNPSGPVSETQATQISQPTISVIGKRKIEEYSSPNPISIHKAYRLIHSDSAQVTTEPQL